jgi:hypothetical protein
MCRFQCPQYPPDVAWTPLFGLTRTLPAIPLWRHIDVGPSFHQQVHKALSEVINAGSNGDEFELIVLGAAVGLWSSRAPHFQKIGHFDSHGLRFFCVNGQSTL